MYSRVAPVYQKIRLKDGTYQLKKVAETDVYAGIQSHLDEVDYLKLQQQAKVTGTLDKVKHGGAYADIADFPRNFNDAQRMASSLPAKISDLPPDVKAAFGSYEDLVDSVVNGTFTSRIIEHRIKLAQNVVPEQKGDVE